MTIGGVFFIGGVWVVFLAGEGRNRLNEPFEAQHQKEHRLDEMPVPQKNFKIRLLAPLPTLTPPSSLRF